MAEGYDPARIAFRWLTEEDLPLMHRWLNEGATLQWYGHEPTTLEQVAQEYSPHLHGQSNVLSLIISYDAEPVGYIQRYFTRDHPDYWGHQSFPEDTAGIDLFIGEERFLHRGFGPLVIRAFLRECVFADGTIRRCIIDPDPANAVAIRAYEKVGFRYLRTLHQPGHCEDAYLMVLDSADLEQPPPIAKGDGSTEPQPSQS
jgi:RimJ/RimL family protein N-acetyltransferase